MCRLDLIDEWLQQRFYQKNPILQDLCQGDQTKHDIMATIGNMGEIFIVGWLWIDIINGMNRSIIQFNNHFP